MLYIGYPSVKVTDFSYVDDIALISKTTEEAQNMFQRVEEQYGHIGLNINFKRQKPCIQAEKITNIYLPYSIMKLKYQTILNILGHEGKIQKNH